MHSLLLLKNICLANSVDPENTLSVPIELNETKTFLSDSDFNLIVTSLYSHDVILVLF